MFHPPPQSFHSISDTVLVLTLKFEIFQLCEWCTRGFLASLCMSVNATGNVPCVPLSWQNNIYCLQYRGIPGRYRGIPGRYREARPYLSKDTSFISWLVQFYDVFIKAVHQNWKVNFFWRFNQTFHTHFLKVISNQLDRLQLTPHGNILGIQSMG